MKRSAKNDDKKSQKVEKMDYVVVPGNLVRKWKSLGSESRLSDRSYLYANGIIIGASTAVWKSIKNFRVYEFEK